MAGQAGCQGRSAAGSAYSRAQGAWAIIRRARRAQDRSSDREHRRQRRQADHSGRSDRPGRSHQAPEREMAADAR